MTSLPGLPRRRIKLSNNEAYELPSARVDAHTSCLSCCLVINPCAQMQRLILAASTSRVALFAYLISPWTLTCPLRVRFKSYIKTVVEHGVWIRLKTAEEFHEILIIFNLYPTLWNEVGRLRKWDLDSPYGQGFFLSSMASRPPLETHLSSDLMGNGKSFTAGKAAEVWTWPLTTN